MWSEDHTLWGVRACLADFSCLAEASSGRLPSVLLSPDRSQLNNHFFWVDDFACPARFPWHSAKNVTRDPAPTAADFSAQDYATLVAHPSQFRKFPEEFMCLVRLSRHYTLDEKTYPMFLDKDREGGCLLLYICCVLELAVLFLTALPFLRFADMDSFAFIHTSDPTKVKVVERVDKLFDEGSSENQTKQGDSTGGGGGGEGVNIQPVTEVADVGGPSHPPKKLLAGAVLNAEVRGEPIPTLPFVTSSVSAMPECESGDHTDSMTGPNLRTISAPQRFVISSDSSHHSGANVAGAEVDSFARPSVQVITAATTITSTDDPAVVVKEKFLKPSLFSVDSTLAGGTNPAMGGFTDLTSSDFLWNVTNGSRLDDGGVYREMVDEFAHPKFFASVHRMKHDQLFIEFNVGAARQMSLSAEVRMRAEYNIREKRKLKSVVEEKDELLKARGEEIENLKAQMLLKEAKAAQAIRLRDEASKFEIMEKSLRDEVNALNERNTILEKDRNALDVKVMNLEASVVSKKRELTNSNDQLTSIKFQNDNLVDQVHELQASSSGLKEKLSHYEILTERLVEFQDAQLKVVNDKFDKLYTDFVEMTLHLEEKFYPHLLTTIAGPIGKAIEKGMQDGLAVRITHGHEGRVLTNVAAYNPSAETNKDDSVKTLMNLLHLEETLAERLGLSTEGTSDVVPATADTTKALAITFASASTVTPISVDDYEVTGMDDQATASESVTDENANPFPNVDDVALNAL
ncbi:hypothetical protein Tco_1337340 [Tanacetum coccineum]